MADPDAINRTENFIRPFIRETPVLGVAARDFDVRCRDIFFKFEFMQHSGSFKVRGAFSNLLQRHSGPAGVVAASGGNHGAAVAYAAQQVGTKATIFVPSVSSKAKRDQIHSYGAELIIVGDRYDDALQASRAYVEDSGASAIHAFDQPETLSGQGTIALEFERQQPDIDTLLVSVGGGGFIGGIAGWFQDRLKVVGVEPELSPTLHQALAAGKPVDAPAGGIAADSLAPRQVGGLMFEVAKNYVDDVVLVRDEDIVKAQQQLWKTLRVVVEPGAAVAMAAIISGRYQAQPTERLGVILCGANMTGVSFSSAGSDSPGT